MNEKQQRQLTVTLARRRLKELKKVHVELQHMMRKVAAGMRECVEAMQVASGGQR